MDPRDPTRLRSWRHNNSLSIVTGACGSPGMTSPDPGSRTIPDTISRSSVPVVERFTRERGTVREHFAIDVLEDREGKCLGRHRGRPRPLPQPEPDLGHGTRRRSTAVNLVAGDNGDVWAVSSLAAMADAGSGPEDRGECPDGSVRRLPRSRRIDLALGVANRSGDGTADRFLKLDPPDMAIAKRIPFRVLAITTDRSGRLWVSLGGLGQFYPEGRQMDIRGGPPRPSGHDGDRRAHRRSGSRVVGLS